MNFKIGIVGFLFFFVADKRLAYPQTSNDNVIEHIVESISEKNPEDFDYSELTEHLNIYKNKPLDINKVTVEELQDLVFLSPVQINAFMAYRDQNGSFIDILELQALP